MEQRAWPVVKPIAPTKFASLLLMAGVLERIRTGQAISLSLRKLRQDAVGSHERWIRRREEKVNWM
jgi:hypothetical protein